MDAPCMNCTKRYPSCHSTCQSYAVWVKEQRKEKEYTRQKAPIFTESYWEMKSRRKDKWHRRDIIE